MLRWGTGEREKGAVNTAASFPSCNHSQLFAVIVSIPLDIIQECLPGMH